MNPWPTCVQEQVVLEVGVFAEAPVADVAFERPRAVVDVHVRLEVARRRERLGAQTALVGLLLEQKRQSIVTEILKIYIF